MISVSTITPKRILLFVILLSSILTACGNRIESDLETLAMTQTAIAATQTAMIVTEDTPVMLVTDAVTPVSTNTPLPEPIEPRSSVCDQDAAPDSAFWIYQDATFTKNHFVPSGYMGDVGDVIINQASKEDPCSGDTSIKIVYKPEGAGPNSCGYAPPCKWAGVYWLEPANNWGQEEIWKDKGYDLTGNTSLVFWARAEQNSTMEFKTGGVVAPYGDSLEYPRAILADLTPEWRRFEIDLQDADLSHIIGGFVFATNWEQNPDGITFYLDDIRFEK